MEHYVVAKSELDLFRNPPLQTTVEHGRWVILNTIAPVENASTLEFLCPASQDECIDLSHTSLLVRARIVSADGQPLAATDHVAPVCNLLHALFSQADIALNDKLVSSAACAYNYRSYIETLLSYDYSAKHSHLTAAMWYKDTPGKFNSLDDPATNENSGFVTRFTRTSASKTFELYGHLHADLFHSSKYLIPGVKLGVKLVRSRDSFALLCKKGDYKIQILDSELHVRKVKISPEVLLAHADALKMGTVKYPLCRTETKSISISAGQQNVTLSNVYIGRIPSRISLCFVSNSAFSGTISKNPYFFHHYNINHLSVHVNNEQFPGKALKPDFKNNVYTQAYYTLFNGTGIHHKDEGNDISLSDYAQGYTIFSFDMAGDLNSSNCSYWHVQKNGNLNIELGFEKALTETVNCIIYAEFQSLLQIDYERNVILDS